MTHWKLLERSMNLKTKIFYSNKHPIMPQWEDEHNETALKATYQMKNHIYNNAH